MTLDSSRKTYSRDLCIASLGICILFLHLATLAIGLNFGVLLFLPFICLGLACWLRSFEQAPCYHVKFNWKLFLVYGGILIALFNFILFEPIHTWDARSIWFFQAKVLFYDGGLVRDSVWTNEAYEFSHLDYPKMLPVLAASVANLFGFWNEYLPKLALLILLIFPVSVCYFYSKKWWTGLGLFIGVILISRSYLWNGYMDSHLAFYSAVSLLLIYRFKESESSSFLLLSILSLGILINLKNEGLPLVMFMILAIIYKMPKIENYWKVTIVSTISFSGYFYWVYIKKSWGIENDLGLGMSSVPVIWGRIFSSELIELVKYYIFKAWIWFPLSICIIITLFFKSWVVRNYSLLLIPVFYTGLVTLVYLGTPHGIGWHLDSSVDRVFMPIHAMTLVCGFLAIEDNYCKKESISGNVNERSV